MVFILCKSLRGLFYYLIFDNLTIKIINKGNIDRIKVYSENNGKIQ